MIKRTWGSGRLCYETVRMTLCVDTRRADIDAAVESLKRNIERLRD